VAVTEVERYRKLMLLTDGGMNISPDVMKKIEILKNAVEIARKLEIEKPKAACLAAVELVNPDMQETIDASIISKKGKAPRDDIENLLRDKLPGWRVDINLDRYIRAGYLSQDETISCTWTGELGLRLTRKRSLTF
jgi:hypothetical protein